MTESIDISENRIIIAVVIHPCGRNNVSNRRTIYHYYSITEHQYIDFVPCHSLLFELHRPVRLFVKQNKIAAIILIYAENRTLSYQIEINTEFAMHSKNLPYNI